MSGTQLTLYSVWKCNLYDLFICQNKQVKKTVENFKSHKFLWDVSGTHLTLYQVKVGWLELLKTQTGKVSAVCKEKLRPTGWDKGRRQEDAVQCGTDTPTKTWNCSGNNVSSWVICSFLLVHHNPHSVPVFARLVFMQRIIDWKSRRWFNPEGVQARNGTDLTDIWVKCAIFGDLIWKHRHRT